MVSTVFSDFIVSATDLRKNQRHWLETASQNPISINYGQKQLAIINRDIICNLYKEISYLEKAIKAHQEYLYGRNETFPWLEYLSDEEKRQFHEELLNDVMKSIATHDWELVEELLQDWKATVEVKKNPEVVKALKDEGTSSKYVTI